MAKGISVHVGVNKINAPGIDMPDLKGCVNDAVSMHAVARDRGFAAAEPLLDEQATFERVTGAIRDAAPQLDAGDIFLFTFSGHGTRRGAEDSTEADGKDETIVLHDRILVDNFLRRALWPLFREGVRVVMVSDSCHSGTVFFVPGEDLALASAPVAPTRPAPTGAEKTRPGAEGEDDAVVSDGSPPMRTIPNSAARRHFELEADFYTKLRNSLPAGPAPEIKSSLLLLAACEEDERTPDGEPHGVYTQALLDTLNGGDPMSYNELAEGIGDRLAEAGRPPCPPPLHAGRPPDFAAQRAFSI